MWYDIDELRTMPIRQLIDLALNTYDRTLFWWLVNVLCSRLDSNDARQGPLRRTAYALPRPDYASAVQLLKEWREELDRCA